MKSFKKVVASEKAATQTLNTLEKLEDVQDVDVTSRANRTFIMYDTSRGT